ncbi:myoneurin-like isoform X13 [Zerene cesonia]|uniref:myoneurin-like isoform X13 n=1 Tax=Zerene cesonia TaxID=33412 RepID=UPI0018E57FAB|nr:myoneurin-like isoform X13 [Zerene cesonia]
MDGKTTEWRPGPTVCRCCLSEGCYKDISTEYFWMGKREVYAEMLLETFDLTISYAQSGTPNSHSRLICEPCISRLRDAADFKRQVKECEQTFLQCFNPISSVDIEIPMDITDKEPVKVEKVKQEKENSYDDDDYGDAPEFLDDDDDLDDQPLMNLATKVPKKETVDVMDLLDNAKAVKRKSSKAKTSPAKRKAKEAKPAASKAKPEKKKKGSDALAGTTSNVTVKWKKKTRVVEEKANAAAILQFSNAVAFRYLRGKLMCAYCPVICVNMIELRVHAQTHDKLDLITKPEIRNSFPLRIDISDLTCSICNHAVEKLSNLKSHLANQHDKDIPSENGVVPFVLTGTELRCVHCGLLFQCFMTLSIHMNMHYQTYVCHACGKGYSGKHKLRAHMKCHESGQFACPTCNAVFSNRVLKNRHVAVAHGPKKRYRCPLCNEPFESYHSRLQHLDKIHDQKSEYRCHLCSAAFVSATGRYSHVRVVHKKKKGFMK